MSERFSGGFITKTPVTPTSTSASGIWTLDQQEQAQKAGNWPFGGPFNYIEDVFSTYLYTGSGSTQTITNGIDLASRGGLVWIKNRGSAVDHNLMDTSRGPKNVLSSNNNLAQSTDLNGYNFNSFLSNGFSLDPDNGANRFNTSGNTYASWSFREQAKFFDVVTYTGNGSYTQSIPHNLGSAPGFVICKKYGAAGDWCVWHRGSGGNTDVTEFSLNSTNAAARNPAGYSSFFTSTTFDPYWVIGASGGNGNESGQTYVAYLFAHNAGGFGPTATDNVISCGSYTTDASGFADVTLGYEPQFWITKRTDAAGDWRMYDNMRGANQADSAILYPNASAAESSGGNQNYPTATGFRTTNTASSTCIYIAIRRGPMKVPTDATKVFYPNASTGTITTGFPVDTMMSAFRGGDTNNFNFVDRLRGFPSNNADNANNKYVVSSSTVAETTTTPYTYGWTNTQYKRGLYGENLFYSFGRAPSFFDEVCYTGTGATANISHNLSVAPELIIVKDRTNAFAWNVYVASLGPTARLELNTNATPGSGLPWNNTAPTNSVFTLSFFSNVNQAGDNYVAYLFASCPGVSKVGSYTGTGATQTISCGFTGGARFVLIKRTDAVGDWYVWDTARGMVSGTDPSLLLNSTAAEVNANSIYTTTGGFQIVSTAAGINASGGSYIYLAIA